MSDTDSVSSYNRELADCKNFVVCGDTILIEQQPKEVRLNKPIQIGLTVLEFAKREIYRFFSCN